MAKDWEPPCGLHVGDVIQPGQINTLHDCRAVWLDAASGVGFTHELGLPDLQRTHVISSIRQGSCQRLRSRELQGCIETLQDIQDMAYEALQNGEVFDKTDPELWPTLSEIRKYE